MHCFASWPFGFLSFAILARQIEWERKSKSNTLKAEAFGERECAVWISSGLSSNIFHIKFWCVRLCAHVSISFGLLQRDFAILHCISCITIAQQWLWYQSWWMTMMMHFANVAWNVIHCLRTDCYWWGQLTLIIMKLWSQKNIILYICFILNS